jgi:hypothetical protein
MESLLFYLENSCGLAHPGSQRIPADFGKESCGLEKNVVALTNSTPGPDCSITS